MKIGIVVRGLTKNGVERFIVTTLRELDRNSSNHIFYIFTDNPLLNKKFKNHRVIYIKLNSRLFWDYIKSPFIISKYRLDGIIYPKNIIPPTHLLLSAKKINIIHDLAYFSKRIEAYKFWDKIYNRLLFGLSCRIANKVIAISNNTKNDLINILKINSKKIIVVYQGVEKCFKQQTNLSEIQSIKSRYALRQPFLFYCGSISPRKNLLRLLRAFNEIKEVIPHNLYLSGGRYWLDLEVQEYVLKNLANRVFIIGHISDNDLITIYSKADIYLYPSLYEGFGLPILEAQACGCPVLTSNTSSCPEIAQKSAHLVDPYSIDEIKSGILKIIQDHQYRNHLISSGYQNIKRFSWQKCAQEIINVIETS